MLYSLNGARPAPLPFRITLASGFTRTDPSTFTPEEITAAGYSGPYTEPPYNPTTQALDWIDGAYAVRDVPPPPPPPDWARFKATLMADTAVNSALGAALPMVPTAVLALPAALMAVSQGGDPSDFFGAWNAIRGAGLVSADLLASVGALAVSCNLPIAFTTELLRPFASAVGQSWTGPDGRRWEVVQARDSQGQFLADNPATPERESLSWQVIP